MGDSPEAAGQSEPGEQTRSERDLPLGEAGEAEEAIDDSEQDLGRLDLPTPDRSGSLAAALHARERIADQRDRTADERDRVADERDEIADRRDRAADARQNRQDEMEQALVERERGLDDRTRVLHEPAPDDMVRQQETIDRAQAALRRGNEMLKRSQAALDRSRKSLERDAATVAREVKATEVRRLSDDLTQTGA